MHNSCGASKRRLDWAETEKQKEHWNEVTIQGFDGCVLAHNFGRRDSIRYTRKSNVAFSTDTKVNGTILKKGTYEVVFDDQSGELSIFKEAKLIAKISARVEKRDQKARGTEVQTILEGMDQKLVSITFSGSHENLVVGQAGMQAGGN